MGEHWNNIVLDSADNSDNSYSILEPSWLLQLISAACGVCEVTRQIMVAATEHMTILHVPSEKEAHANLVGPSCAMLHIRANVSQDREDGRLGFL